MKTVIFDLETTGVDTQHDRIVQIAIKVLSDEGEDLSYTKIVNPTIPIPSEASEIHGITDEMVKDAPTFKEIVGEVTSYFSNATAVMTYNGNNFDIPLLLAEMDRVGVSIDFTNIKLIDVLAIERKLHPHTLSSVYKKYTGNELEEAHDAMADVEATLAVFNHQSTQLPEGTNYEDFVRDGAPRADIAGKTAWDGTDLVWTFGKYKGQKVTTDQGYLLWILRSDFPRESKNFIHQYLQRGANNESN